MFSTITAPEIPFCHSYLQVKTYQSVTWKIFDKTIKNFFVLVKPLPSFRQGMSESSAKEAARNI
uniref:Uncharacterized protein n=1 Tax=Candidatus Kentrum sp. UNK TaxID=2126344 RepID=A0A451B573_9GAMM|nr:MAG: hypothetical protein BECKUNK1418G_GA0071005_12051 [Candidatus Kentron sp. UNK]VFK73430.1 MAG: hypothetical protein BECKUNK1418H_GA0071006_12014 [Candidatus Kentron sp. UNK]